MDLTTKIKGLLKGAEVYSSQGLFVEARDNYRSAVELIKAYPEVKNREKLLDGLAMKIEVIEARIQQVESAPLNPQLSAETQSLIKKLFSFPQTDDQDNAALDGAIALTKFGQYPRAITEFLTLLDRPNVRLVAAKNILRCHLATDNVEEAIAQYGRWLNDPRFDTELKNKIRPFLETLLKKKDAGIKLPEPVDAQPIHVEIPEPEEDEVLDISSMRFQIPDGPRKGQFVDYEVSFQNGNVISILISERDKEVAQNLRMGETLANVELTSVVAIFNGTARIMAKNDIKVGPRKGFVSIDLKIKST